MSDREKLSIEGPLQVCRPINRATRSFRDTLGAKKHGKSTIDKVLNLDEIRKCR